MTWLSAPKGCGKCNNCGMDMDMAPYCVETKTLEAAALIYGHPFHWGLSINDAREICKGDQWTERKPRS